MDNFPRKPLLWVFSTANQCFDIFLLLRSPVIDENPPQEPLHSRPLLGKGSLPNEEVVVKPPMSLMDEDVSAPKPIHVPIDDLLCNPGTGSSL